MSITAPSDVPTLLVALHLYEPDLSLFILGIVKLRPVWRTSFVLFILTHLHVMFVFGFASVTVHINVAVSPSITLYGFDRLELTSGLSSNQMYFYQRCVKRGLFI